MADEKLVALLKQGSSGWNEWTESTQETTLDLINADLTGANLQGANLFSANLQGANLFSANLQGANLSCAVLRDADLSGASLTGANLFWADLGVANLSWADLGEANLSWAYLEGAHLRAASLRCAVLSEETILDVKWRLVWELQNEGGRNRDLSNADLSMANLSGVDFSRANLSYSQSSAAIFHGAKLFQAKLNDAQLDYANLRDANLSGAKLIHANLRETNLINANLHGADLTEADLTNAVMTGACIYKWKVSSHSNLEQVECDFVHLRPSQKERYPQIGSFGPGEFAEFLYEKDERSSDSKSPGNIIFIGDHMSKNKFEGTVHANIIGDNAHDNTIQQVNVGSQVDLKALAEELTKLREYLAKQDIPDEYAVEVTAITQAESAAKKGDESTVLARLGKAGAWTLEVAKEIGVKVLAALIEKQLDLP